MIARRDILFRFLSHIRGSSDEIARTLIGDSKPAIVGEPGRLLEGDATTGISNSAAYEVGGGMTFGKAGYGDPELILQLEC